MYKPSDWPEVSGFQDVRQVSTDSNYFIWFWDWKNESWENWCEMDQIAYFFERTSVWLKTDVDFYSVLFTSLRYVNDWRVPKVASLKKKESLMYNINMWKNRDS